MHAYSSSLGHNIGGFAEKSIGSKLGSGIVEEAIHKLTAANSNILKPIGEKAFGATVYKNFSHNITKVDDIRPGDIICMRNTKCTSHKGLGGLGTENVSAGDQPEKVATSIQLSLWSMTKKKRQREGCRERKRRNREKGDLQVC